MGQLQPCLQSITSNTSWEAYSSSRGIFPSDLHSYSKRRFIGPLVSLSLRQWGALLGFLRKWIELSLVYFFGILLCPPSHPPTRGGNLSHCSVILSGLVEWIELLFWLSLNSLSWCRRVGEGGLRNFLGSMVQKFFNRSPITLKFGGRKN